MILINPFTQITFGAKSRKDSPAKGQIALSFLPQNNSKGDSFESNTTESNPNSSNSAKQSPPPKANKSKKPEKKPVNANTRSNIQKAIDYFGESWETLSPKVKNYLVDSSTNRTKKHRSGLLNDLIKMDKDSNIVTKEDHVNQRKVSKQIFEKKAQGILKDKWDDLVFPIKDYADIKRPEIVEKAFLESGPDVEESLIALLKALKADDTLKVRIIEGLSKRQIPKSDEDRSKRKEKIAQAISEELNKKTPENKPVNSFYTLLFSISALKNFLHDSVTLSLLQEYKNTPEVRSYINETLESRLDRQYAIIQSEKQSRQSERSTNSP